MRGVIRSVSGECHGANSFRLSMALWVPARRQAAWDKLARQYELYQKLRLRRAVRRKNMSDKKEKKTDDSGNCMIFGMLIGSFIDCIKKQ